MQKPLTVARQEFAENIVNLINGSQLPAFVIGDILKSVSVEIDRMSNAQYKNDKQRWEEEQAENESKSGRE